MKHRVKILTFLFFGIAMLTLACSRAASPVPVTPSPELSPRQKLEKALTIIQEQKNKFLQKQQTLGEQIKSTHQSMQPAERDIKLKQYGAYLQAVGDLESLEARLELAITKLEAQEAIGETQNLAEQTKEIETQLKLTLDIDPLDNSANATVDTEALLAGLLAQTATITSNETTLPTPTPEVATPTDTPKPTDTPWPTPTTVPSPTPFSGIVPFASPNDPNSLNPVFGWQPGGSDANSYDLKLNPGNLTLVTGADTNQEGNTDSAPLVAYPIEGNFEAQVKVVFNPRKYCQAANFGIRSAKDHKSWLRIGNYLCDRGAGRHKIGVEVNNGQVDNRNWPVYSDNVVYFKIERKGVSIFSLFYSTSGDNWVTLQKEYVREMTNDVEIFFNVLSHSSEGTLAQFSDFEISRK